MVSFASLADSFAGGQSLAIEWSASLRWLTHGQLRFAG
jgi:hypothetical protein